MQSRIISLDQIENRVDALELIQKSCAAVLVGLFAWLLIHAPFALRGLTDESESNALMARLFFAGQAIVAAVFALPLVFLNTRQSWLLVLGGLPMVVLAAVSLAASARPLGYRLADWSTYPNVQINLVLILGLVVFISWTITFTRGWLGAAALLRIPGSAAYRGHHLRTGRGRVMELMFGVPHVVGIMRKGAVATTLLYLFHALFCGIVAFLPFIMSIAIISFPNAEQQFHYNQELSRYGLGPSDAFRVFWAMVYTVAGVTLALPFLMLVASWVLALARSTVRVSMQELLRTDQRRPILFLRSFRDDQVEMRPARRFIAKLLAGSSADRKFLDHLVTEELSTLGPVVALGSVGEKYPPYGAARGYFEHGNWQDAVRTLMDQAVLIVLVLDDTPGTWWEVEQIAAQPGLLAKTIFLTHPEHAASGKSVGLLERVTGLLGREMSRDQLRVGAAHLLGFHVAHGETVWFRSRSFTSRAYGLALRAHSAEVLNATQSPDQAILRAPANDASEEVIAVSASRLGTSRLVASATALVLAAISVAIAIALKAVELPDRFLGVSVRPWLASAVVLVPLLLVLNIRRAQHFVFLVGAWVFAGWLSGRLYHSILQMDQVTWDIFDHHAEFAAHAGMFLVMAAVMIYLFGLDVSRVLRAGAFLALLGAGLRWGFNAHCWAFVQVSDLSSPLLWHAQHFLITWPGLMFVAVVLSQGRVRAPGGIHRS